MQLTDGATAINKEVGVVVYNNTEDSLYNGCNNDSNHCELAEQLYNYQLWQVGWLNLRIDNVKPIINCYCI